MNIQNDIPQYQTLADIRLRKAQLLTDITKDSNRARSIVNGILHPKPKQQQKSGFGLSRMLSTGVGVVDGVLFAWKLYNKFGGSKVSFLGRLMR